MTAASADPLPIAPAAHEVLPPASTDPQFRLGDAARPFAWSTVIADFNRDSRPDLVIADHVAGRAGGYEYRLEFSISGQTTNPVTFESRYDAITISVADVDHDNDLDVIVGTPLSGEPIAVWLNDGQGHFTAGDVRLAPAIRPLQSLDTTQPLSHFEASELSPRRAEDALLAVFGTAFAGTGQRFMLLCRRVPRSQLPSTQTSPRAPPEGLLAVLS